MGQEVPAQEDAAHLHVADLSLGQGVLRAGGFGGSAAEACGAAVPKTIAVPAEAATVSLTNVRRLISVPIEHSPVVMDA